jgi:hypothetical protein
MGGDGNDEFNLTYVLGAGLPGIDLSLFGELFADALLILLEGRRPTEFQGGTAFWDGGSGVDKLTLVGTSASEYYGISGTPDRQNDPEIRVTDLVTGMVTADVHMQQTEEMTVRSGDSDDRIEVNWDAALMSGLTFIQAALGKGNDTFVANLLPVLTEPSTREVQTARFEVLAGVGNDQVSFNHSAGSWFDVFFTADTGLGTDTVNALLLPPPDDSIPGPEGLRRLQFDLLAGNGEDLVAVHNLTTGEFFDVFLEADLGSDGDTFEAVGGILPCVHPGRGFDTARVTRNLLPFVTEFERVEILE